MKVITILSRYGLLTKSRTWDNLNKRYVYDEEYNVCNSRYVNCKEGGRKILDENMDKFVVAYHLQDYGGFFIVKGHKLFYAFVVFRKDFDVGGMGYKSCRISDLSEVENKIDLAKVEIFDNEQYNEFTDEVKRIKLKNIAKNL
jgi:hypothetical protein